MRAILVCVFLTTFFLEHAMPISIKSPLADADIPTRSRQTSRIWSDAPSWHLSLHGTLPFERALQWKRNLWLAHLAAMLDQKEDVIMKVEF